MVFILFETVLDFYGGPVLNFFVFDSIWKIEINYLFALKRITITINSNFVCKEGVNILQEILYANRRWYIVVVIVRKSRKCRPWFWLVVLYLTKTIHNIVQVLTIAYYKANAEGKEWRLTVDLKEEISTIKRRALNIIRKNMYYRGYHTRLQFLTYFLEFLKFSLLFGVFYEIKYFFQFNIKIHLQVAFLFLANILALAATLVSILICMVHGCIRHGSPSTCIGTGFLVRMTAVRHWQTLAPLPPAWSMARSRLSMATTSKRPSFISWTPFLRFHGRVPPA